MPQIKHHTLPIASTLAALGLLSACVSTPAIVEPPKPETVTYRCAGEVEIAVVYSGRATGLQGTAELVWEGHSFPLKQEA